MGMCISHSAFASLIESLSSFLCDPQPNKFCKQLVDTLSLSIQAFINCSINNAVPVTYCLTCAKPYDDLRGAYANLNVEVDDKNISCQSLFFDRDRLGLIQKSYLAGVTLWTGGFCDDCYEAPMEVSNKTLEFLKLTNKFQECTRKRGPGEDVCEKCAKIYDRVNKNYDSIKRLANDAVCFDLQDKINETRRYWSIEVECNTNPDDQQITFLILTAAITSLPICFYVLMFAHTHHSESVAENMNFLNESTTEPEEELQELQEQQTSANPSVNLSHQS